MKIPCALCLVRETAAPYRAAGLDICATCWTGALGDALDAWGLSMEAKHWTEYRKQGDNSAQYVFAELRITLATPCSVHATFTPDRPTPWWLRWLDLAGRDPEIGDPLFDDYVRIDADPDAVAALLVGNEGLQTGIMSALGTGTSGEVTLSRSEVFVRVARAAESGDVDQAELNALAVAIAVQVERHARGLER